MNNIFNKKLLKTNWYYCEPIRGGLLLIPNLSVDSDNIEIIELSGTGKIIWDSIENHTVEELIATVWKQFDDIDVKIVANDVCEFLQSLFEKKAIKYSE